MEGIFHYPCYCRCALRHGYSDGWCRAGLHENRELRYCRMRNRCGLRWWWLYPVGGCHVLWSRKWRSTNEHHAIRHCCYLQSGWHLRYIEPTPHQASMCIWSGLFLRQCQSHVHRTALCLFTECGNYYNVCVRECRRDTTILLGALLL